MNLREIKISANFREYLRERLLTINFEKKMKKETWKYIVQTILAILTAIATTFGVTSCMGD